MQRSLKSDQREEGKYDDASSSANSQNGDNPSDDESEATSGESEAEQNNDAANRPDRPNAAAALQPDDNCILFGRGKGTNNRPANKKMRLIIDKYRDRYQAIGRGDKLKLVKRVHEEIVAAGMKFLKPVEGENSWEEVDTADAIKKVGHALRCNKTDKRPRELDSPSQPNISANSLMAQRAAGLPDLRSFQGSAMAPSALETNWLAQRDLNGMLPLSMQQNLLADNALMSAGIPSYASLGASYPSVSLERQLMEMEMNRLMSAASLPLSAASPFGDLNGLSPEQLRLLIEREQQLRLMLLQDSSSMWPGQLPGHPS